MKGRKGIACVVTAGMIMAAAFSVYAAQEEASENGIPQAGKMDFYVFPDSDSRLLGEWDVSALSQEDIRIAKNEIYARHGRRFNSPELQEYFDQMSWYLGNVVPEHFDERVFNDTERANIRFLDQEWQKGTGADRESLVMKQVSLWQEMQDFVPARIADRIGLDAFSENVNVSFSPEAGDESKETALFDFLDSFYVKDDMICGNIGFDKSIYYLGEGQPCAWYRGSEYTETLAESRETQANYTYTDVFHLYKDNERIAAYETESDHASGTRPFVEWILTEDVIYAGGGECIKAYAQDGTLLAEENTYRYPFAADERYLYVWDQRIVRLDRKTLQNPEMIIGNAGYMSPAMAGTEFFVYHAEDGLWRYDYDTGESCYICADPRYNSYAVQGEVIYTVTADLQDNAVISRLLPDSDRWEPVCRLEGVLYASLAKAEGSVLYLSAGTPQDWESDHGMVNQVQIAVDLETGTVSVLGAGWYS